MNIRSPCASEKVLPPSSSILARRSLVNVFVVSVNRVADTTLYWSPPSYSRPSEFRPTNSFSAFSLDFLFSQTGRTGVVSHTSINFFLCVNLPTLTPSLTPIRHTWHGERMRMGRVSLSIQESSHFHIKCLFYSKIVYYSTTDFT